MHKKVLIAAALAACTLTASAQVSLSELAGKYHLQGECNFWESALASLVTPHEDFTFSMSLQEDNTFHLSSFFYSGMDGSWVPLDYSATAEYHPDERLLYVYPTEWMWDEYMNTFMDPYSHDPMLYFAVEKDTHGNITLSTTPNSVGFYVLTDRGEGNKFYYAIDYPDALTATKVATYQSVTPNTIAGEYDLFFYDFDGKGKKTTFTINRNGNDFTLTGMFGDKEVHPLYFEPDGKGVYAEVQRKVNDSGYYTYYFGGVVGECRVSFHFDADGNLVSDNYITYTPNWSQWVDALNAVAKKKEQTAIEETAVELPESQQTTAYDLQGRPANSRSSIVIRNGRKVMRK